MSANTQKISLSLLLCFLFNAVAVNAASVEFARPPETKLDDHVWDKRIQASQTQLASKAWLRDLVGSDKQLFLNALITQNSPYLLQHAFNPVDWRAWNSKLELEAQSKLRFISIGYSSCHWCHEMARQSFANVQIGALLNKYFVAIKVDREELPEVDAHYTQLQRRSGGAVGWPVTVIETAHGEPLFVGAYLSPEQLTAVLSRFAKLKRNNPEVLTAIVNTFAQLIGDQKPTKPSQTQASLTTHIPKSDQLLAKYWDRDQGGLIGEQKFPNSPALTWLIASSVRDNSAAARAAVRLQLDSMLSGGLYDVVHGGFFRYSTQSDWSSPHFEKMLYNQAQLIGIYVEAARIFARADYLLIAQDTLNFANRWLQNTASGLYQSAVDAQYQGVEGGYYLLDTQPDDAWQQAQAAINLYAIGERFALRINEKSLKENDFKSSALRELRQSIELKTPRPFVDEKLLTSWNAMLAMGILQLAEAQKDLQLRQQALHISEQLWLRFDQEKGLLWRDQFAQVPASLEDYAQFSQLLINIYDVSQERTNLMRAMSVVSAALVKYQLAVNAGSENLLWEWRDTELTAPRVGLCRSVWQLSQRLFDEAINDAKAACQNALDQFGFEQPSEGWSAMRLLQDMRGGSTNRIHFAAEGQVRIETLRVGDNGEKYHLKIAMQDGWHINAHEIADKKLKPTVLKFASGSAGKVRYPKGKLVNLEFSQQPLLVYEGEVVLEVNPATLTSAELTLQACSDSVCLLPEKLRIYFW